MINSKQPTKFLVYITDTVPHIDKNTFATLEDKWHTWRHKNKLLSLNLTSSQLGDNNINPWIENLNSYELQNELEISKDNGV